MTTKTPGAAQAAILLAASGLTTLMTAILGPSLPQMEQHFASVPGASYLVPLTITTPMLVMALFSIFAGAAADRFGRRNLLLAGTLLYAAAGTLPMWLDSLYAILASRVCIGLADAAVMTCSLTMIGDYWQGTQRQRILALQTTVGSGSAVVLSLIGGALGELGWRAPYAMYAIALLFAPLMFLYLWEPQRSDAVGAGAAHNEQQPTFRPRLLAGICALAVLGGISFLLVPIHLAYLMRGLGVDSTSMIGTAQALNSVGVVCGTLLFGWVVGVRCNIAQQFALCTAIAGAGCLWMAGAGSYAELTSAATLNGLGCGLLLPTLTTWNMRELPFTHRGFGTGAFMSCLFFGMFTNPIIIVALANKLGGRPVAVQIIGWCLVIAATVAVISMTRRNAVAFEARQ